MREFFKGWRRKAGCLLLLLALSEWHTLATSKNPIVHNGVLKAEATFLTVLSACLLLVPTDSPTLEFFRGWRRKSGCVALLLACALMGLKVSEQAESSFETARMQEDYPNHHLDTDGNMVFITPEGTITFMRSSWVPVLCIVIPLTLVSAYLILWKPRSKSKDRLNA